jgi:hypothetical protein
MTLVTALIAGHRDGETLDTSVSSVPPWFVYVLTIE